MNMRRREILNYILESEEILSSNNIKIDLDIIKNIVDAKMNKEYTVSVVGSMKSGKSTFINALIGDDLMPSENAACTLTTTTINNSKTNKNVIIKEYDDKSKSTIEGEDLSESFHNDIKEMRKNNENQKFYYTAEHKIEALTNMESYGKIKIVDTPGLNEMEGLGVSKKFIENIFDEQLKKTNFLIYIFDYKYYKSQENVDILKRIIKLRKDIIEDENIIFIINKIDLITYKDGNIDNVIEEIKKMLIKLGITECKIFNISSKKALISRLINNKKNLEKYKKDIDQLRPIIQKEIGNEVIDVQMPIEELEKKLLIDSNIQKFENEVLRSKYIDIIDDLDQIFEKISINTYEYIKVNVINKIQKYEKEVQKYNEDIKFYSNEIYKIREAINEVGKINSIINEKLEIPRYEIAKQKEMKSSFYVNSDYVYPYCDYDEYYKNESKANEAGIRKFKSWKKTIKLEFEDIYKEYNYRLTGGNYVKSIHCEISKQLEKVSDIINKTLEELGIKKSETIITKFKVMLEPIMNLNYDNSTCYISDLYDNSQFISYTYSERYVKGMFGERLKEVVQYDLENAIKNEEEDYEKAFRQSSADFFEDYYRKKYRRFIPKVKKIVDVEMRKSETIFKDILVEKFKKFEDFKRKEEKEQENIINNIQNLKNILEKIGE